VATTTTPGLLSEFDPISLLMLLALMLPLLHEAIPDPREPRPERESPGQHLTRRIGPYSLLSTRSRNYRIHFFNWDASVLAAIIRSSRVDPLGSTLLAAGYL
jgi:hypothetical protein